MKVTDKNINTIYGRLHKIITQHDTMNYFHTFSGKGSMKRGKIPTKEKDFLSMTDFGSYKRPNSPIILKSIKLELVNPFFISNSSEPKRLCIRIKFDYKYHISGNNSVICIHVGDEIKFKGNRIIFKQPTCLFESEGKHYCYRNLQIVN